MMIAPTLQVPLHDERAAMMVEDTANILKRFYFVQRTLVVMLSGRMPAIEHWQTKMVVPE